MEDIHFDRSVDNEGIISLLIRRQIELNALLEITQAINNNFSAATLFKMYEFVLTQHLKVKNLCVLIQQNQHWEFAIEPSGLIEPLTPKVLVPLLANYKELTLIDSSNSLLMPFKYVIPVKHKNQPLAYVLMGTYENIVDGFNKDMKFIETLTNVIVVAIENKKLFKEQIEQEKYKKELEFASQVQSMLIPHRLPESEHYELNAYYKPHSSVGGDYYDCMQLDNEQVVFCVGDVSGKGVSAALLMANFQANLRALVYQGISLEELVRQLNRKVYENTRGDKFITFFIAQYNYKSRKLKYVNAGHNPPLLIHADSVEELASGSTLLGAFEELPNVTSETKIIMPHALVLCYTDGLTEGADGFDNDVFGKDKLAAFSKDVAGKSAEGFNKLIIAKLEESNQLLADDVTLLTCRFS